MNELPPPPAGPPPPAPPPSGWDPRDTAPRQLSPLSMLAGIDPRSLVFGAVAILSAGPGALVIVPVVAVVAVVQLLQWQAFRYGFDGEVVRVQQGVLQRRTRSIDVARIQQVEVDQPLLHRLTGLAVLRLETASEGGETEVELNGVTLEEAEALRAALRPAAAAARADVDGGPTAPEVATETVLEVPHAHLALSAVTGAQLLALPAALAVLSQTVFDLGAEEDVGQTVVGIAQGGGLAILVLLGAVVAFVAAVVAAVVRDGGYRVAVRGDDLVITRGLLTTRETVLPRHRVQVVEVRQNWLRRALGVATIHVRSAGGGAARDDARRIQVPLVPTGIELDRLLEAVLPGRPHSSQFRSHPPAARRRSMVRATLRFAVLAVPLALVAAGLAVAAGVEGLEALTVPWQVPAVLAGLLLLAGPPLGLAEYGHLAHALGDRVLASRHGALGVTTAFAPLRRLQGVTQTDSPFQRRLDLASVTGHLAGGGATTSVVVLDVDRTTALRLRAALTEAASRG